MWFLEKRIPKVPLLSGILITFFGGLTIYFDNPVFIYIKPTIINIKIVGERSSQAFLLLENIQTTNKQKNQRD